MNAKTNVARILDQNKINYNLQFYEVDEHDLSANLVAETLQIAPETIFKTLVLITANKDYVVALIPGNQNVDLKKMAKTIPTKSCEMLPLKDLQKVTGYLRGGCSPIGMKKKYQTFIHKSALKHQNIIISAGKRGVQVVLSPNDLQILTSAQFSDLV